ncbi:MAG TPA: metal ABC transporter permease [Actinomycetota bacterium]|nr:metal ABC transporter permease [Actinomycetota bacterium]
MGAIVAPGFFANASVRTALTIGAVVAAVSGPVGVFTVLRGQSFAAEGLSDIGAAGGSGAYLVGAGPLAGFVASGVLAAGALELTGAQRPRGRDVATGIVLGAGLGLAALFLYLGTRASNTTGATVTILFGSLFAVTASTIPLVVVLGVLALGIVGVLYRPLFLASISPDLAGARGVPVRAVGALYLLALALAVALAAVTIGTILSTALIVGPAATALRVTRKPGAAMAWSAALGVGAVWLGILGAYDSYRWPPGHHGWPVSFLVVVAVFGFYLLSGLPGRWHRPPAAG